MTSERRFVFDTNSIVSALLLKQSISRQAFDHARGQGILLVSLDTLAELSDVLRRPRFAKYVTEQEREQFLAAYVYEATLIEVKEVIQACRDPKDDKFLELAVTGHADTLVTGDQDLLVLHPFRGITIVTARGLLGN